MSISMHMVKMIELRYLSIDIDCSLCLAPYASLYLVSRATAYT